MDTKPGVFQTGFLGYPTTFMLDFVVCALVLIVPCILVSLWLVRFRKAWKAHRNMQLLLGVILLFAVVAFEVDMRLQGGWQQIVAKQQLGPEALAAKITQIRPWLLVHLVFAVTTPILWATTIGLALRRFGSDPRPGHHSRTHTWLGWLSTVDITLTSLTGLAFYYVAFVR